MKKLLITTLVLFVSFLIIFLVKAPSLPQNFLILGLDPRNDLLEKTETTDTIILAHLDFNQSQISLVSLPRDLWYYPLSVKINQIFPLSLAADSSFDFVKTNFSRVFGQNIDRVLVLTTQNLEQIIDLVGGVDVYLDTGFTDKEYPNPEYIQNPSPDVPVYITVEFPAGWNHLTAANVAPFVRSRKSAPTAADGGTDLGRIKRQQLLLQNLFQKMLTLPTQPRVLWQLFKYYRENINTDLRLSDLIFTGARLMPHLNSLKLAKIDIPIGNHPQTDIIYDPEKLVNGQWVFLPQDDQYHSLQQFIKDKL